MFTLIPPSQFRKVPWKNGLGHTLELMMNPSGTLDNFDWRLSIATVAENGIFSDFSGYSRILTLIAGNGMSLTHDQKSTDHLNKLLQFSSFDGGATTVSRLHDGPIDDFNVMINTNRFDANVVTFEQVSGLNFAVNELAFIYSVNQNAELSSSLLANPIPIPANHLLCISMKDPQDAEHMFSLSGKMLILVRIKQITP